MNTLPFFGIRMNTLGFRVESTGGGCLAYVKHIDDERYVMVTDGDGYGIDRISPDFWAVCAYLTETDQPVAEHLADDGDLSLDAALRAVGVAA